MSAAVAKATGRQVSAAGAKATSRQVNAIIVMATIGQAKTSETMVIAAVAMATDQNEQVKLVDTFVSRIYVGNQCTSTSVYFLIQPIAIHSMPLSIIPRCNLLF